MLSLCKVMEIWICVIFRKSVDTGHVPQDWRTANITPLFKKGKRSQAENYRPVRVKVQFRCPNYLHYVNGITMLCKNDKHVKKLLVYKSLLTYTRMQRVHTLCRTGGRPTLTQANWGMAATCTLSLCIRDILSILLMLTYTLTMLKVCGCTPNGNCDASLARLAFVSILSARVCFLQQVAVRTCFTSS